MANYGRDYRGSGRWFGRWTRGYDDDFRSHRHFRGGRYDESVYRRVPDPNQQGYGASYDAPRTRGYFNPGYAVDEAWGGAYSVGDANYAGRRIFNPGNRPGGDRYARDYDWQFGRASRRPIRRGYDRGW
ncbi:MAG TPA: hypothetical protein VGR37_02800 [Longimicrobiaceae bacterium]|nr:hypothetical protein [Longimicrobiaceae bacterium]